MKTPPDTTPQSSTAPLSRRQVVGAAAVGAAALAAGRIPQEKKMPSRLPTVYLPHGGGPCFFMEWTMGPRDTWKPLAGWLASLGPRFKDVKALLVVSAHWEETTVTVQSGEQPPLFFDYYGFPPETYQLTWPAPGAPQVARRVRELLEKAGIKNAEDPRRGFDHGSFVPLKVAFPDAQIPCLQLSLDATLDPARHLALGKALEPLRDEGVLIVGSGMSFHNMRALMSPGPWRDNSVQFDSWLGDAVAKGAEERSAALSQWSKAPQARFSHPREEHLLPLMVCAGAAGNDPGRRVFGGDAMGVRLSAFEFGAA
jgi:aromatic ring-opening dioxygenase catalytic subunit (LigB family)